MFSVLLVASCATEPVPAGMKRLQTPSFSLLMPESMVEVEIRPIDSYVREFKNDALILSLDYGMYSDPLDYANARRSEWTVIDGRRARLVEFEQEVKDRRSCSAVHFPQLDPERSLTVYLCGASPVDRTLADQIFRSIRFTR
jgi:hypothetical protein